MTNVVSKLERVVSQVTTPPERIFGWQYMQMSIARHDGGINYNGHGYTISYTEEGQPLVRNDVLRREAKAVKAKRKEEKQRAFQAQKGLI